MSVNAIDIGNINMECVIDIGNSSIFKITGLKNAVDGTYINDASVTVTLTDRKGVEISGETFPLTVPPVASTTTGEYQVILSASLAMTKDQAIIANIDITSGSYVGHIEKDLIAKVRKS